MKRESKRGGYMGDVVTAENRREYIQNQARLYREQLERTQTEENKKTEDELNAESQGYGLFRARKEQKHFKAYLRGDSFYVYAGQTFPVMTGEFIREARTANQLIDIHKIENKEEEE